jgi:crossover junction endodeoxyribonuclease RuvC
MPTTPSARSIDQVILGIDPGTLIMGFGILRIQGQGVSLLDAGHWRFRSTDSHLLRLSLIFKQTLALIEQYQPNELAIEAPFYAQNVQSLLKLGRAQGAAIAAALHHGLPVFEYLPKKIKQAVTGNGNASKQQVASMLSTLLQTPTNHFKLDATDALGAAYCHFLQLTDPTAHAVGKATRKTASRTKKKQTWEQFLLQNPERKI